jgi:hypothetical protein
MLNNFIVYALVAAALVATADEQLALMALDASTHTPSTDSAHFDQLQHIDLYRAIHASNRATVLSGTQRPNLFPDNGPMTAACGYPPDQR